MCLWNDRVVKGNTKKFDVVFDECDFNTNMYLTSNVVIEAKCCYVVCF